MIVAITEAIVEQVLAQLTYDRLTAFWAKKKPDSKHSKALILKLSENLNREHLAEVIDLLIAKRIEKEVACTKSSD